MRLPESTVKMLDGTARIVREHSSPSDKIFVYPELGIFYSINHRMYPTVSGSHNIDVINDGIRARGSAPPGGFTPSGSNLFQARRRGSARR